MESGGAQDLKISVTSSNRNNSSSIGGGGGLGANSVAQSYQCHWLTKVKYNQSHDQLLLTCDTATFMNLYNFQSVSSNPKLHDNLFGAPAEQDDFAFDKEGEA